MHYYIILNPVAGGGKSKTAWSIIQPIFIQHRVSYDLITSHQTGEPTRIAKQIIHNQHHQGAIIVIGGDGTLHEVVNGLMQSDIKKRLPLGYVPAGTGNDFARGYGISLDPNIAVQQILDAGHITEINIAHYRLSDGRQGYFLNNLGIGFDGQIVFQANHSRAKRILNQLHLGKLSYGFQAVSVLSHLKTFKVSVGKSHVFSKSFITIVSNHPYIGGGFKVAPDQKVTETNLELLIVEKRNPFKFLKSLLEFASGKIEHSRIAHTINDSCLSYSVSPAQNAQVDGEELGHHTYNVTITCDHYPFLENSLVK